MMRRSVQEALKAKRMEMLAAAAMEEDQQLQSDQLSSESPQPPQEEPLPKPALVQIERTEAQEIIADFEMKEGKYDRIIPSLGLTSEKAIMFEALGVPQQTITTLRSLFTSLDKDGG